MSSDDPPLRDDQADPPSIPLSSPDDSPPSGFDAEPRETAGGADESLIGRFADSAADTGQAIAEGVGTVASASADIGVATGKKVGRFAWARVLDMLGVLYGWLILIFLPIPVKGLAKSQMASRILKGGEDEGTLEFYSQPNIVATIHLIWVGWVVTVWRLLFSDPEQSPLPIAVKVALREPITHSLTWIWLIVLCLTLIALGIQFGRTATGFLIATIVIVVLSLVLWQQVRDVNVYEKTKAGLKSINITMGWGVPMVVSAVLGFTMAFNCWWQRKDDRWELKLRGNFLEHENFQQKDRTIQKGAKTFLHSWPCLIRRWLLFGFGEIEVRDSRGLTQVERIDGVFWALRISTELKRRFETTDVSVAAQLEEEEAE